MSQNNPHNPYLRNSMTAEELDHTPMGFGKYPDQTPDQILEINANWLVWAYENINNYKICSELCYKEAVKAKRIHAQKKFQSAPASPREIIKAKETGYLKDSFDSYDELG